MKSTISIEDEDYFVVYNGLVRTMDDENPLVEAFAVKGDRFIDIGRNDYILSKHPLAKRIDANGKPILPGLIDAHAHLMNQGLMMIQVDLFGSTSVDDAVHKLLKFVEENPLEEGEWLLGRGWDQTNWGDKFPTKEDLDPYFPNTAIYLKRVDGHAAWVNSEALRQSDPLPNEDPEGGEIIRDEQGNPTGILIDNAMWLVEEFIPPISLQKKRTALSMAIYECNKNGLTGVHDAGVKKSDIDFFKREIDRGTFNLRNYVFLACENGVYFCPEVSPILLGYGDKLTVRSVKLYLDGALGSWGAAMIEPYSDDPTTTGLLRMPPEEIEPNVRKWVELGYQVNSHAIGDLANRIILDAYENVQRSTGKKDLRLRVEHSQIIAPEDIPRFASNNIIPSYQPTHATSDMRYAESRLGPERIKGAYAWQTLAKTGARLPLGSDFPVEKVSPWLGIYSSVTRKDLNGMPEGGWYPEESLTIDQTLKGFTIEAAYAAFQEKELGSITPGKFADFIIIDRDVYTIKPEDIPYTKVLATYLGGSLVYSEESESKI